MTFELFIATHMGRDIEWDRGSGEVDHETKLGTINYLLVTVWVILTIHLSHASSEHHYQANSNMSVNHHSTS